MDILKKSIFIVFLFICNLSYGQYWPTNSREHLSKESYVQGGYNIIAETDTTLSDGIWGNIGAQFLFNKKMQNEFASHLLFNIGYFSRWDSRAEEKRRNYSASVGFGINDEDYVFGTGIVTYLWQENAIMIGLEGKIYPFNKFIFDRVNLAFVLGFSGYKPLVGKHSLTAVIQPGINLNFKL